MQRLRAFFISHSRSAWWLIVAALCMKALVPAGYMIGDAQTGKLLTITICSDGAGDSITRQIALPAAGRKAPESEKSRADGICPFSALGHAMIGGADPIQLALALLFLLALGFAPWHTPAPRPIAYLRPPLRGPPAV
jgi:hypothetical protein